MAQRPIPVVTGSELEWDSYFIGWDASLRSEFLTSPQRTLIAQVCALHSEQQEFWGFRHEKEWRMIQC